MSRPSSEELLPEFMLATTDFLMAAAMYFGLHAVTVFVLTRGSGQPFTRFSSQYAYVLSNVINRQNVFYLLHLLPALGIRYCLNERLNVKAAACVALMLSLLALLISYPMSSLLSENILKNILLYVSLVPFLMTLYTLRINRLRFSGALVLLTFIGLLIWGTSGRH